MGKLLSDARKTGKRSARSGMSGTSWIASDDEIINAALTTPPDLGR